MKLIIFGATGTVGRQLAEQALSENHQVTVFVRNPAKFGAPHPNLRVMKGDVLDPAAVRQAVVGHDVVLCALGRPLMNKEQLRTKGTQNIVQAMQQTGVQRLICLSALGAAESRALLPMRYTHLLIPLFMRRLYADHEQQEACIRGSGLDWVIVRPSNFLEGPRTGAYRHGFNRLDKSWKLKIPTGDVADFMLKQLTDNTYLRSAPALSC
ncbi:MAG: SDR family oxidoreductase [Alphaproteobacteria bacterium]|nr:SDR family oxidoreductase [Alphaproteobacteria bacterium]